MNNENKQKIGKKISAPPKIQKIISETASEPKIKGKRGFLAKLDTRKMGGMSVIEKISNHLSRAAPGPRPGPPGHTPGPSRAMNFQS